MKVDLPDITGAKRVVCWFSCGAASAAAAKVAIDSFEGVLPVVVAYCDTMSTEHPDNARFFKDCRRWFDRPILRLRSKRYADTWEVFDRTGWLVGPGGARCTVELKKSVRQQFERPFDDIQVFGFDADEGARAARFSANNPEARLWAPLVELKASKGACQDMLARAGIRPPAMYALGYRNNNCIGCVKGQSGYWNKIRVDFPEVFDRMARLERRLDVAICKTEKGGVRTRVFLDELDPRAGRYAQEPAAQCGVLCGEEEPGQLDLIEDCDV